jgi:hypothetical protein
MNIAELTATEFLQHKTNIWIDQIVSISMLFERNGNPNPNLSAYREKIHQIYSEELELARLLDTSDFIVHANGAAIQHHKAALGVVAHLFANVEKQVKRMAQSVMQTGLSDTKQAMKMLDVRLTGIAPGSLYAGFVIEPPTPSQLLGTDEQNAFMATIKEATLSITNVPSCVKEGHNISEDLAQYVEDPAIRDSAIVAAYNLSPTGRGGISSIDLINPSNRGTKLATLNASHRQLLREVSEQNPLIKSRSKYGTFTGTLTKVDLAKNRVDLRNIGCEGFDFIRCIMPALTLEKGRESLGAIVSVSGMYEASPLGRPSLMQIEDLKIIADRQSPLL